MQEESGVHLCLVTTVFALLTMHVVLPVVVQGFRIAGKQGIGIIAACQLVLMGGPEYARYVLGWSQQLQVFCKHSVGGVYTLYVCFVSA